MKLTEILKSIIGGFGSISIYQPPIKLEDIDPAYSAKTPQQRDAQALAEDWRRIGQDMETAIKKFERRYL